MAQKPTFDYDVIVIGSGAGGSPAATVLARAGKKVAIIERGTFGGESPNWGDIPTGALLYTADVYHEAKTAGPCPGRRGNRNPPLCRGLFPWLPRLNTLPFWR